MKKALFLLVISTIVLPSRQFTKEEDDEYYDDTFKEESPFDYQDAGAFYEEDYSDGSVFEKPEDKDDFWVPEGNWNNYWPPRRKDGSLIPETQEGQDEWDRMYEEALELYFRYSIPPETTTTLDPLLPPAPAPAPPASGVIEPADILANSRIYPYCVDGHLPIQRNDKGTPTPSRDEREKNQKVDPDLENFLPFFTLSQPRNGVPEISDKNGRPVAIEHLEDGVDEGPYIQMIRFLKITSPLPALGDGAGELALWIHLYIKSRIPLEGLYIQAIGHPNGLPFGNFHNDFECSLSGSLDLEDASTTQFKVPLLKTLAKGHRRRNTHSPCKYAHAEGHGTPIPSVFAYGGGFKPEENPNDPQFEHMEAKEIFRTHFSWASAQCHLVMRIQFLVLAVRSFVDLEYEAFLTPSYLVSMPNADGQPYVVASDWVDHGQLTCNQDMLEFTPGYYGDLGTLGTIFDYNRPMKIYFSEASSVSLIKYRKDYDDCILTDKGLDDKTLTCPPRRICLNSLHLTRYDPPIGGAIFEARKWGFRKGDIQKLFRRWSVGPRFYSTCSPIICKHPKNTIPKLRPATIGETDLRFSAEFMKGYFDKMARLFRGNQATHGWCLIFAWFILMGIGTFAARYLKEDGGINEDLRNGCLGFGFWIWTHLLLLVLAITFMWIGILEITSLRRKPAPCSTLEIYQNSDDLKMLCRGRKKIIRLHKKIAISAVVFFHMSIIFAWTRPLQTFKMFKKTFKLRRIFIWLHIILAYLSKLVAILSTLIFFSPYAKQICKDLPIWVLVIEIVTISFFVGACAFQCFVDKSLGTNRSHVPVPEAFEPTELCSTGYLIRLAIVLFSCLFHFILFVLVLISCSKVYNTPGDNADKKGQFEVIKGLYGTCNITSTASETEMNMQRFYYTRNHKGT